MNPTDESRLEDALRLVRERVRKAPPDSTTTVQFVKGRDGHLHIGRMRIVTDEPGVLK